MKKTLIILAAVALLVGCKKKQETDTIITTMEVETISNETRSVGDTEETQSFDWGGVVYEAKTVRKADKELKAVKDDDGNRYYENKITLAVTGPSGSIFNRTFSKSDFASYIDSNYLKPSRSTLMSIAFNRVKGANAYFMVTVGSPNQMDDEYMCVQLAVTKDGGMALSKVQESE